MICSEARLAANRRNAQKSTGPKTEEGKARSRANALKHGLCSSEVVVEDAALIEERTREFFDSLRPQNDWHCWLATEIAVLSVRITRSERIERRARDKVSLRAELTWDDDRKLEAELLGERLAERPAVVVDQLRRTPQGCEWMMTRWAMLAHAADVRKSWTPAQTALAFDLLATPPEFREGHPPGASLDFRGRRLDADQPIDPASVARREVDLLEARRDHIRDLDDVDQALSSVDLIEASDPELKTIRRHEATLHRRLRWCLAQLKAEKPPRETPSWIRTRWLGNQYPPPAQPLPPRLPLSPPLPEPVAQTPGDRFPDLHPPFDLEPDEEPPLGQKADIPKILHDRAVKRLRKVEARREAQRRKVDQLRA